MVFVPLDAVNVAVVIPPALLTSYQISTRPTPLKNTPVAFVQPAGPLNAALLPVFELASTATRRVPAVLAAGSVGLMEPVVEVFSVPVWSTAIAAFAGVAVIVW